VLVEKRSAKGKRGSDSPGRRVLTRKSVHPAYALIGRSVLRGVLFARPEALFLGPHFLRLVTEPGGDSLPITRRRHSIGNFGSLALRVLHFLPDLAHLHIVSTNSLLIPILFPISTTRRFSFLHYLTFKCDTQAWLSTTITGSLTGPILFTWDTYFKLLKAL
jgi:hypothetical protein